MKLKSSSLRFLLFVFLAGCIFGDRLRTVFVRHVDLAVHDGDDVTAVAEDFVHDAEISSFDGVHPAVALEDFLDFLPDVAGLLGYNVEQLGLKTFLLP